MLTLFTLTVLTLGLQPKGWNCSRKRIMKPTLDAVQRDTTARILDAASSLLVDSGYEALSMRKVAAMVGLSQAAIYRHYRDKAELVAAVVEKGYGLLRANVEKLAGPEADPVETLAAGIRGYVVFAIENSSMFKAVLLQGIGPSQERVDALSPGIARQRKTFEILAGIIERGMATGHFAACDPEITAQALWAAMFGLATRMVLEKGEGSDEERRRQIVERQVEILIRGLRG